MTFDNFLSQLHKIKALELGGNISHAKVEPAARADFMKTVDFKKIKVKNASVMLLVYPKNNLAHMALILRTSYNGVHSSQVAFPGGKAEDFDENFWQTALRETEEEIGISASKIEFIKDFTPLYVPPSNFMVYPYMGMCTETLYFVPDPNEVAGIIELSIDDFLNDDILIKKNVNSSYMFDIEVDGFQINDYFVWGATAMVMQELKDLLKNVL